MRTYGMASVRARLIGWYALWLAAGFILAGAALRVGLRRFLEHRVLVACTERAQRAASLLASDAGATNTAGVSELLQRRFAPEARGWFMRVTDGAGRVLFRSGAPADRSFDPALILPTRSEEARRIGLATGEYVGLGACSWRGGDGALWRVEVAEPLAPAEDEVGRLLIPIAVGLGASAAVALAGAWRLIGRALHPVEVMAETADRITSHNLSERLPAPPRRDELAHLAETLNRMISRLEDAFRHNQRFLEDASHELRTPLTILRGELEAMVQEPGIDGARRERIGALLEEVERLGRLVERLLTLSRLDAGLDQDAREPVDLSRLASTTADQMRLLAEDKGLAVETSPGEPVIIRGDPARLKQVFVNLLDNAIKYTPCGGRVRVAVAKKAGEAVCEVADTGVGIPADAQPHLFERFYRVDKARNRDEGGAGIGLSIVAAICHAHGGEVEVESTEGVGSVFRVRLPLVGELKDLDHGHGI